MRRYWPYLFLSMVVFLGGCSCTTSSSSKPASVSNVVSEPCKNQLHQQQLAETLRGDGVQVIQVGEETTLVLQTDTFFYPNSNNMKPNTELFKEMVDFINSYPTVNIQVKGYPNKQGCPVRSLALSRAQAEGVARKLWENGLDTRLISADARQRVSEVPRIEIFFRLPPPTNVFH